MSFVTTIFSNITSMPLFDYIVGGFLFVSLLGIIYGLMGVKIKW